jgi:hypothetical protein
MCGCGAASASEASCGEMSRRAHNVREEWSHEVVSLGPEWGFTPLMRNHGRHMWPPASNGRLGLGAGMTEQTSPLSSDSQRSGSR